MWKSAASDEEIKTFLVKYGFPPFDGIDIFPETVHSRRTANVQ